MTANKALKECPFCYSEIDARATVCPNCGKNTKEKSAGYQIGSFLMAFGLLGALAGLFIEPTLAIFAVLLFLVGWVIRRNV